MTNHLTRRSAITRIAGVAAVTCHMAGISALPVFAGSLPSSPEQMTTVPQTEGSFSIYTANNRPLAMLTSGSSIPIPMMFDTGSNGNMVDTSVARFLDLKRKPNHKSFVTDATGTRIEAYAALVPDMKLGGLPISSNQVDVYDYRADDEVGILGPDLFRGCSVYVNLRKDSVYVRHYQPSPLPGANFQSYTPDNGDGLPSMQFSVDGMVEKFTGLIDTGKNGALSFPEAMIDKLPLASAPIQSGTATTVFKTVPVYSATIDAKVRLGSVILDRPEVIFHGDQPKIGMPVLRQLRIWLEPHNQRSWIAEEQTLDMDNAESLVRNFGERSITLDDHGLIYQKVGRPQFRLLHLGGDHFVFQGDTTELIWRRNEEGKISGFTLLGNSGEPYEVA